MKAARFGRTAILLSFAFAAGNVFAQSNIGIAGHSGEQESVSFSKWIEETDSVLKSELFRTNLLSLSTSFPQVYLTHDSSNSMILRGVKELADMLLPASGYRYVSLPAALVGGTTDDSAYAGWTGFSDANGMSLGSLTLGRAHLAKWLASDPVQRSCAINTLAHEQSHSLSTHAKFYNMAFTDFSRRQAPVGVPAASYLVGTVAQCTWLQQQGRIPASGFKACVSTFGTRHFNSLRCTSFADGQAVADRPDLPAAATD